MEVFQSISLSPQGRSKTLHRITDCARSTAEAEAAAAATATSLNKGG